MIDPRYYWLTIYLMYPAQLEIQGNLREHYPWP